MRNLLVATLCQVSVVRYDRFYLTFIWEGNIVRVHFTGTTVWYNNGENGRETALEKRKESII